MLLIFAPFLFKTVLMEDHADVKPMLSKFSVFCFVGFIVDLRIASVH
jgi:hypothetical protein